MIIKGEFVLLVYNRDLEADIKSDTSGNFRLCLVSLLTANRPGGNMVDRTKAEEDAANLIKAGVKKFGTEESRFNVIFCSRRFAYFCLIFIFILIERKFFL